MTPGRGLPQYVGSTRTSIGQRAMLAYLTKRLQSEAEGEFVIDTLVPGARFYIRAAKRRTGEACVPLTPLKPGEDRDLGTITLKERKP